MKRLSSTNKEIRFIKQEIEYLKKQKWSPTISRAIRDLEMAIRKLHNQKNIEDFAHATDGDWLK